jgi:hypothetical protein
MRDLAVIELIDYSVVEIEQRVFTLSVPAPLSAAPPIATLKANKDF